MVRTIPTGWPASSPGVSVCQKTTNRRNPGTMHHGKDQALSQCIMGRLKPKTETPGRSFPISGQRFPISGLS